MARCLEQHVPSCLWDPEMLGLLFVYIFFYSKHQGLHLWAIKRAEGRAVSPTKRLPFRAQARWGVWGESVSDGSQVRKDSLRTLPYLGEPCKVEGSRSLRSLAGELWMSWTRAGASPSTAWPASHGEGPEHGQCGLRWASFIMSLHLPFYQPLPRSWRKTSLFPLTLHSPLRFITLNVWMTFEYESNVNRHFIKPK